MVTILIQTYARKYSDSKTVNILKLSKTKEGDITAILVLKAQVLSNS
jgi:hypothetical protein